MFRFACTSITDLKFEILFLFHFGYLSVFPHNKYSHLIFNHEFAHDTLPVMKYITSYTIRHRYTILLESLSQMYIRLRVTQVSVRLYRNNCIIKYILIFVMQEKHQTLPTQTVCSKTYSAISITLSASEPKRAESWQSDEER